MAGEPAVDVSEVEPVFYDLPNDELGRNAIAWAYKNGITKYYSREGEFAPYNNITRREVAIFLWRMQGEKVPADDIFDDLTENLEYRTAISWAYDNGITKYYTKEGEFAPMTVASRREAAIFLMRASKLR